MKIAAVCLVLLAGIVSVAAAHQAGIGPFANSMPVNLPAPHGLTQAAAIRDRALPLGGWTHRSKIRFSVQPSTTNPLMRIQIELAQNGAAATNTPTATSKQGPAVIIPGLGQGTYRWWARFYDGSAVSPWVPFSGGTAFKVDVTPPTAPVITSSTDPIQSHAYKSGTFTASWSAADEGSGVTAYRYLFYRAGGTSASALTTSTTFSQSGLATGKYTLQVSAKDHAGNWGPPSTYHVRLDSTAPTICNTCYGFSAFAFNPHYSSLTFNYRVSEPAAVRIGIYNQSTGQRVRLVKRTEPVANQLLHYVWRGRDNHGNRVAPGNYEYVVRTTDSYGNSSVGTYSGLQVIDKVIIVSLTQQRIWAYQAGKVMNTSLVTTGNINCCATPPGLYTVLASYHPFTFKSPAPVGSFYYYPPSPVQYALLFQTRGFYIHDAPWRSVFGPGTNTVPGVPGSPETGSHGCVNTPLATAEFLYGWAPVGTPVKVLK